MLIFWIIYTITLIIGICMYKQIERNSIEQDKEESDSIHHDLFVQVFPFILGALIIIPIINTIFILYALGTSTVTIGKTNPPK